MSVGLRPLRSPEDFQHVSGLHPVHQTHKELGAIFRDIATFHVEVAPREQLPVDFCTLVCRDFIDTAGALTEAYDPDALPNHLIAEGKRRRHYLRKRPCDDRNEKETAKDPVSVLISTFPPPASMHVHALLKSGVPPEQVADCVWRVARQGYQAVLKNTGWIGLGYGIHTDTKSLHFESAITRFLPEEPAPQFPHGKRSLDLVGPETVGIQRQLKLGAVPTAESARIHKSNLARYSRRKGVSNDPNDIRIATAIDDACESVFGPEYEHALQLYRDWHKRHVIFLTENTVEFQRSRADKLAKENAELVREDSTLRNQISDQKISIKHLTSDLEKAGRHLRNRDDTISERNQTIAALQAELEQMQAQVAPERAPTPLTSPTPAPVDERQHPAHDADVDPPITNSTKEELLKRIDPSGSAPQIEPPPS